MSSVMCNLLVGYLWTVQQNLHLLNTEGFTMHHVVTVNFVILGGVVGKPRVLYFLQWWVLDGGF